MSGSTSQEGVIGAGNASLRSRSLDIVSFHNDDYAKRMPTPPEGCLREVSARIAARPA